MMSEASQIATLIATLPLVLCFTGILVYTSRKTGRASKGVLLLIVLFSRQAWAILIGTLCLPVVAAVLYLVVYVAELVVSSFVIAAQGRTLKHCHSREGASVYNQCNAHANLCQTRVYLSVIIRPQANVYNSNKWIWAGWSGNPGRG